DYPLQHHDKAKLTCKGNPRRFAQHPAERGSRNPQQSGSPDCRRYFCQLFPPLLHQPDDYRQDQQAMIIGRNIPPCIRHRQAISPEEQDDRSHRQAQKTQMSFPQFRNRLNCFEISRRIYSRTTHSAASINLRAPRPQRSVISASCVSQLYADRISDRALSPIALAFLGSDNRSHTSSASCCGPLAILKCCPSTASMPCAAATDATTSLPIAMASKTLFWIPRAMRSGATTISAPFNQPRISSTLPVTNVPFIPSSRATSSVGARPTMANFA